MEPQAARIDATSSLRGSDSNPFTAANGKTYPQGTSAEKKGFRISGVPVFNTMRGITLAPRRGLIPDFGADLEEFPRFETEVGAQGDHDEYMDSDYLGVDATPSYDATEEANPSSTIAFVHAQNSRATEAESDAGPYAGESRTSVDANGQALSKAIKMDNDQPYMIGESRTSTDQAVHPTASAFREANTPSLNYHATCPQHDSSLDPSAQLLKTRREDNPVDRVGGDAADGIVEDQSSLPVFTAAEEQNKAAVLMRHYQKGRNADGEETAVSEQRRPAPGTQVVATNQ